MRFAELAEVHRRLLLEDVVPFWIRHSPDRECGGFLTFLDEDGSVYGTDKAVWLQGRIAWLFARLYNEVERREEWLELSRHGLDFLERHGYDQDRRMFFLTTRDGRPLRKRRYVFSETFAAIAFAEYARATGDARAIRQAAETFRTAHRYHTTPGLLEPKEIQSTRPSKGHAMPMILLATATILQQVDSDPLYEQVIDASLREVFEHFCHPEFEALLETVGPNGEFIDTPEGRTMNPGHAIETSWFIMDIGRRRRDPALIERGAQILGWMLEKGWDERFGGILYFRDVLGKPSTQYEWDMKLWWPHVEAMVACAMAFELTGEGRWMDWYRRVHDWAFAHFPDPKHGEWYGYLHRDGTVSHRLKGNGWKGPFHLGRSALLCWRIFERLAATE
ncbi:MAG: AGE family epimerase/isomerase [Fimbriimonadales bacterium]|nr:AGE family epimerase/isomerase [Fimbriimonadales bacterium]